MNKKKLLKNRTEDIALQELDGETLVYDLKNDRVYCLNKPTSEIWRFCDGNKSLAEITVLTSKKLQTSVNEDFVLLALSELNKNGLLAESGESNGYFAGINRREMIRKVGVSSLAALPLITFIVAPTAINAASTCGCPINNFLNQNDRCEGRPCNSNDDCCGNCSLLSFTCLAPTVFSQPFAATCCPLP